MTKNEEQTIVVTVLIGAFLLFIGCTFFYSMGERDGREYCFKDACAAKCGGEERAVTNTESGGWAFWKCACLPPEAK